ncbi:MAG: protein kinase domain-containing protein [Gemmatimonadaceae bacterium]
MPLSWKIFLSGGLVIAAVAAFTLAAAVGAGARVTDATLARELRTARTHVRSVLDSRERGLEASAQAFARNANFRSAAGNPQTAHGTLFDHAREGAHRIGASTVHVISARGIRLARSDDSAAAPDTLTRTPLVARALAGRRAVGATAIGDTALHQAIAVPIEGPHARPGGVLLVTKAVDDSLARAISATTFSHVVFFAIDTAGRPRITGSSLPHSDALTRFLDERAPIWAAADAGSPSRAGPSPSDSANEPSHTRLTLGDAEWAASGATLRSAGGTALGGFVALRSRDEEMTAFTRLQRIIIAAATGGLILALAISLFVGRALARRIGGLEAATRRAAAGDYGTDVPAGGRDEVGHLAESVQALVVDVREQRELAGFLAADAREDDRVAPIDVLPSLHTNGNGLHPGERLAGRYDILELLGSGISGTVYRAVDLELSEPVAVKTLRAELVSDSAALARLNAELRIARRISHRNVLRTHDLSEVDGTHFVTMEYVPGTSVRALLAERGRLPVHVALPIARQLCRALEAAHAQGIVHRDLKPHNLVLTPDGVLKVMDFGMSRLMARSNGAPHPATAGMAEYMAPEQLRGEDIDLRADIYSAGVVIYECLTGRTPYTAENALNASMSPALDELPVPPCEIAADVPRSLSDVILTALHRDRGKRPKSAAAFLERLAKAGAGV